MSRPWRRITVLVPADAEVLFDGTPTAQKGDERTFVTPALPTGKAGHYDVLARWKDSGKTLERSRRVEVSGGAAVRVDFLSADAAAAEPTDNAKEEAAIQKTAEAFVEAFNKGDAKAVAAFWTPDGDMVDREGHHVQGRKAIEALYQKFFSEAKGAKLYIRIASLRVVNPDLALEDGETEIVLPDGPPAASRYTVVHVKQEGQWMIESVREATAIAAEQRRTPGRPGLPHRRLDGGRGQGRHDRASYVWNESQNFIVNTFDVTMQDIPVAGGKQIIGWDAAAKKPRSWAFYFNGGFSEGVWTPDGDNKWKVAITGQKRDGSKVRRPT